jgi:hypothetical protein
MPANQTLREQRNQVGPPLLRLAPELRNRIYEYALMGPPVRIPLLLGRYSTDGPHGLGLLRTCKQIYSETVLLLY